MYIKLVVQIEHRLVAEPVSNGLLPCPPYFSRCQHPQEVS